MESETEDTLAEWSKIGTIDPEVLEEFVEHDGGRQWVLGPKNGDTTQHTGFDQERRAWINDTDYLPPWRELIGNNLGPAYGPDRLGTYYAQLAEWYESRAGGGLWDQETADEVNPGAGAVRRAVDLQSRQDGAEMAEFFYRKGRSFTNGETEIYYAYFVDGLSLSKAAKKLEISVHAAHKRLERLRERMVAWSSR